MRDQKDLLVYQKAAEGGAEHTFRHYFFANGCLVPNKTALEWLNKETKKVESVTYRELMRDVVSLGEALYQCGLQGKTAALIGDKSYSWVLVFITAICCRICVVPIDGSEQQEVILDKLHACDASVCFADDDVPLTGRNVIRLADVRRLAGEGQKALDAGEDNWLEESVMEMEPCMMMFTSGTGGKRKLAVLRQESLVLERTVWQGLGMAESGSKCLITLPLFHIAGLCELRGALMLGVTVYLSSGLKYLFDEYAYVKPEIAFMVPAQAMLLYSVLAGKDKTTAREMLGGKLRAIRTSGAPLPQKIRDLFLSFDIEVTSDYGMTETAGAVSVSVKKDGRVFTKPGSVGHILDCLNVYAENPDENGCGEIVVEGPCVFYTYYKDPEEAKAILRDGKLYTGDIGYVDEDRFLFLVGRKKNIIILSNGENIIPEELEKRVYQIPEVKECLVYAENDRLAVKVYSDNCTDEEHLIRAVRNLNAGQPNHKVIQIIHVEQNPLPKTETGKVLRGNPEKKQTEANL